jgi:hypothetical protein
MALQQPQLGGPHILDIVLKSWQAMLAITNGPRGALRTKVKRTLNRMERELAEQNVTVYALQHMATQSLHGAMLLLELCVKERMVPISPAMLFKLVGIALFEQQRWATLKVEVHSQVSEVQIESQVGMLWIEVDGEMVRNRYDGILTAKLVGRHWSMVPREDTTYNSDEADILTRLTPITTGPEYLRSMIGLGGD